MTVLNNFSLSLGIIFAISALFIFLPRLVPVAKKGWIHCLTAFATGALIGVFAFDLLPIVLENLSRSQIYIVLASLPIFYFLHERFHRHHSHHDHVDPHVCQDSSWDPVFWVFLVFHSFFDGFFLDMGFRYSEYMAELSSLSLLAHKAMESLFLSAFFLGSQKRSLRLPLTIYLLAFPAGALTLNYFFTHSGALGIEAASLATTGSLLMTLSLSGLLICLIMDGLVPVVKRVKQKGARLHLVLLGCGLLLAFLFVKLHDHA